MNLNNSCSGVIEWGEAQFVNQDDVVAEQGGDHPADAVVGQPAVEGFGNTPKSGRSDSSRSAGTAPTSA